MNRIIKRIKRKILNDFFEWQFRKYDFYPQNENYSKVRIEEYLNHTLPVYKSPPPPLRKVNHDIIKCECDHNCPIEYALIDNDGLYTCPNCYIEEINNRISYDSKKLIGNVQEDYENLKHKGWEWRSFYNGWIQGRVNMLIEIKGIKENNK